MVRYRRPFGDILHTTNSTKQNMRHTIFYATIAFVLASCTTKVPSDILNNGQLPNIYPDYVGVTIPEGIAPLNFSMADDTYDFIDVTICNANGKSIHSQGISTDFDIDDWHEMLNISKGDSLKISVSARAEGKWEAFLPFGIYVSCDTLSAYGLTYRRIEPGYKIFDLMGIYERNLSNFTETPIYTNTELVGACVNCHTSNRGSSEQFMFHVRGSNGGTVIRHGGKTDIINGRHEKIIGSLVYPSWHPSGQFVACSSNDTKQSFHMTANKRIEVFDNKSDIVVYHPESYTIITSPLVNKTDSILETFPQFSADGSKIYFCSALNNAKEPDLKERLYTLCSIDFDAEKMAFGNKVDTILDFTSQHLSIIHPRISPDGKFLMFTTCYYGTFPIWHKEAELWMLNLEDYSARLLDEVNSDDSDSFHNWSNDSRWFVFTSRRDDGLFTRLYIAHCDEEGQCSKPFMLPQRNPKEYYSRLFDSYNTPDFATELIKTDMKAITSKLTSGEREMVK